VGVVFLKNLANGKTTMDEGPALWEQWVIGTNDIQNMVKKNTVPCLYNHVAFSRTTAPLIFNTFCASSPNHMNKTFSTV